MAVKCFDVVDSRASKERYVVYQSDFLRSLDSRLAIPLVPEDHYRGPTILRLTPTFLLDGQNVVLVPQLCISVQLTEIRTTGLSLENERDAIRDAFDFLTTGF